MTIRQAISKESALEYHKKPQPGKIAIAPSKPMETQLHLSLAYSPGVAYPCLEIAEDKSKEYDYTSKGNMVAVISNGTAVLGLGNLGAAASKPVMEGKAVLFKRFADIDAVDVEVNTEDPEEFIKAVSLFGSSWGGINLEDIKSPECFIIEKRLKEIMDIPVFHDDQHGTAIITLAALMNAVHITGKSFKDIKIVSNGAGAASIACIELIKSVGVPDHNVILCDREGVIHKGRKEGMNQWKEKHAIETKKRNLTEALDGADVFIGLSVKGVVSPAMIKNMNKNPIIFAMANPDPEITPEEIIKARPDAIFATGRSDYPNQVNNVMGFPYIFRGALDVQAKHINEEMKIAAAEAIASLAREPVPAEVLSAYGGRKMQFGPEYIIPAPFDPRLIHTVPLAVAKAAIETGVARKKINLDEYKKQLKKRLNPIANTMNFIYEKVRQKPRKIIFAEGEEEKIIRTAVQWRDSEYGTPILIGKENYILAKMQELGMDKEGVIIQNAAKSLDKIEKYIEFLYKRLQRKGFLYRDCVRMVTHDRNIFAACMLAFGEADGMITGVTRGYARSLDHIMRVIDIEVGKRLYGLSVLVSNNNPIFIADTTVHHHPTAEELADTAIQTSEYILKLGFVPRVAFISFSNFGSPNHVHNADVIRQAIKLMDNRKVNFEYDGEMSIDVAINSEVRKLYPFCKLSGPANVLIMPDLQSASISSQLLHQVGKCHMVGPVLCGLAKPVQIIQVDANISDIINLAAIAVVSAEGVKDAKK